MRVFVKENTLWKPLCVSNTSFVDTDEFMKEMHRFVLANGTVNNVYIEFENTKVPVSHVNEIRVVAQLVSAYHNTVLESALKGEKVLYGNSYTPNVWPEPQLVRPDGLRPRLRQMSRGKKGTKRNLLCQTDRERRIRRESTGMKS